MIYTEPIYRRCCNTIADLIHDDSLLCDLHAYFDMSPAGLSITRYGIDITPPLSLADLSLASAQLKLLIEADGYQVSSVVITSPDGGLLISVYQTTLSGINGAIVTDGSTAYTEEILNTCSHNIELREDGGFELRDSGGIEIY